MGKKVTFSTLAVTKLRAQNPSIETHGFARALRNILESEEPGADSNKEYRPGFLPDAYLIDKENQDIWIYEVEDTNPLTLNKLILIAKMFWLFDWLSWTTHLVVFDRYGENPRELDLLAYTGAMAIEANNES